MISAFNQLGLGEFASSAEVKEAWRRLAAVHHPDKGGEAAEFARLRQAYTEALTDAQARERVCQRCHGTGLIRVTRGFATVLMTCDLCGGSGEVDVHA